VIDMKKPLFQLGRVVATPGAIEALEKAGQSPWEFISAHAQGQWGDELCSEDKDLNDAALVDGSRILSCYKTKLNERLYVITEAVDDEGHRAATTILCCSEY
jgi:hypothetical protein